MQRTVKSEAQVYTFNGALPVQVRGHTIPPNSVIETGETIYNANGTHVDYVEYIPAAQDDVQSLYVKETALVQQ